MSQIKLSQDRNAGLFAKSVGRKSIYGLTSYQVHEKRFEMVN